MYASLITAIVLQHSTKWPLHDSAKLLIAAPFRRRSFKKFKTSLEPYYFRAKDR